MKKLLALVLALVMSMSLVTISNAAFKDADKIDYKEAVDVMNAVGVFVGDEKGNFNAKENLTREQAAKIIAYLELGSKAADALVGGATFTDVASTRWSAGFVGYCAQAGVVAGNGDGKFDPAGQLTALQFGKMLLVELGYDAKAAGMVGADWAINTSKLMASTKLMDKIDGSVNQVLTREKAAQMSVNALKAPTVEYSTKGSSIIVNGAEINFGASVPTYVTNTIAKEQTISKQTLTNSNAYTIELGEKLFKDLKLNRTTDDFGRPANEWFWKAAKVGTYADKADLSYTEKVKLGTIYSDLGLGEKVLAKNVTVYVDGDKGTLAKDISKGEDTKIGGQGTLTEVYYDSGDNTAVICHINYYIGEVQKTVAATASKDAYIVVATDSVKPAGASGVENFTTDAKFDDDAMVYYTYSESAEEIKSVAVCETASGTVTEAQNAKNAKVDTANVTIGGTKYKAAAKFVGEEVSDVMVKYDYKVYLDGNANMLKIEKVSKLSNEYALVRATQGKNVFSSNKAQVVFADGTEKVVSTAKDYNKAGTNHIDNNTIVTWTVEDGVYTLQPVATLQSDKVTTNKTVRALNLYTSSTPSLVITNDKAGMKIDGNIVKANSNTVLVLYNVKDDSYTTYTGIKSIPTIETSAAVGANVYYFCDRGDMATILFVDVDNDSIITGAGKNAIYLAGASRSNLIQNSTGNYYEYNAIVDDEITTVKVDKATKVGSKYAYELDGMFKSYNVNSKGVITSLTAHADYADDGKGTYLNGVGLDKTSKDYTVILNTAGLFVKADGTEDKTNYKNETITCDEKATFYYVDKDGKITEITYKNVTKDLNDKVYAYVDDYMVKQLVVFEVKDTNTNTNKPLAMGEKPVSYVDGSKVVLEVVDTTGLSAARAEATNALRAAGYTRVKYDVPTSPSYITAYDKNLNEVYFDVYINYYVSLTVDDKPVEYVAADSNFNATKDSATKWSDISGKGTGFVKGTAYKAYFKSTDTDEALIVKTSGTTTVIKTGYVQIGTTQDASVSGLSTSGTNKVTVTTGNVVYNKATVKIEVDKANVTKDYTITVKNDGKVVDTFTAKKDTAIDKTVSLGDLTANIADSKITVEATEIVTPVMLTKNLVDKANGLTFTWTLANQVTPGTIVKGSLKITGDLTAGHTGNTVITLADNASTGISGIKWVVADATAVGCSVSSAALTIPDTFANTADGVTIHFEFTVDSSSTNPAIKATV